ncbi:hypothetical protein EB796_013417 [Bugula neritina]|nr:hypothetical protein EB796_013417 [Bugula neritina]
MTIPLPEDYKPRKTEGKLVIVSGTGDGEPVEVIEKMHISEAGAEFLTRLLTWKAAVTVSSIDTQILSDVCESMRKYTRKRMHFVKHLVMFRPGAYDNTFEIALVVVTTGNEVSLRNEWISSGYIQGRCIQDLGQQMMCEGERTTLTILGNPVIDVPVAFFSKQVSSRVIQLSRSPNQIVRFQVSDQQGQRLGEGEICM